MKRAQGGFLLTLEFPGTVAPYGVLELVEADSEVVAVVTVDPGSKHAGQRRGEYPDGFARDAFDVLELLPHASGVGAGPEDQAELDGIGLRPVVGRKRRRPIINGCNRQRLTGMQ